jgi:formylglycine-generating enzyme required for sulfatase activity
MSVARAVLEYCADKYSANAYSKTDLNVTNPMETEGEEYVVRGGSYNSDAADLRSAARSHTFHEEWIKTDPQQPKSIWWYTDIKGIGFRVVCEPDASIN